MPDDIQRTIYKLEIDDSGYIRGVESMSGSTKKLAEEQTRANKALQTNEAALKTQSEFLQKTKRDLDAYTGTNERYRAQLQKSFKDAQTDQAKLTQLVADSRKRYDEATAAAQKFATTAARATELQQQTTGGKIPTGPPLGIPSPITNFTGLTDVIPQTKTQFDQLAIAIATAEQHLNSLDKESEEFKLLAPIVDQGKLALQQYAAAADSAGGKTLSIRGQLRAAKEELVRLEQAGLGASKAYFELEKRTAKLTDQFNDQQQRIKILASDTKLLDFGKGAITAATSAFQTYAAVSILAGDESAELQKKTMQLFAAMQLLQSLEQLSNLTRREGVLATLAQSGAQSVYTAVIGASTGALKAFRIALFSTGILAVVATIGFLVKKFIDFANASKEAGRQQKLLNEITNEGIKGFTAEVTHLNLIKSKLDDLSIPQKKRVELAKEYNKTAEEGNKIDLKQIDNIALVNKAIDSQIEKIKQRGLARAAENIITQRAEALQLAEEKARLKNIEFSIEATKPIEGQGEGNIIQQRAAASRQLSFLAQQIEKDPKVIKAKQELQDALSVGSKFITTDTLTTDTKTEAAKTIIQNEFARKKAELDARLAELTRKEADNESKIRIEFAARLVKEQLEIDKLLKEKKLTKPQAEILKAENIQINTVELDKALTDFRKKVSDARKKINDELQDLQNKVLQDSINLLQDEFDRRAALIEFNEKKELEDAKQATEERLAALEFDRLLIGEQAYQDAKASIISNGELQALNILRKGAVDRQNLSADIFRQSLDAFQNGLNQGLLARDEELAKQIRSASDRFLAGKITFEQFQKELTAIQRQEEGIRRDAILANQRSELAALERQIASIVDKTSQQYKDLLKLRDDFKQKIAEGEQEDAIKDAEQPETDPRTQRVVDYAEAIGQLTDSIISFWQKANQAESEALDRSVTLQERRVEAAQRIAERGNAQYLKQEEDRLKEVQIARENAARRELAINAALQASQLLVGITGAISKLASGPLGAAQVIGEIAVIFAALATGYGLVKSLQGNQPKLAKGTKYVKRDGHPSGQDTIPAWLNEGEAVIPTEKNKAYHPTVKAIYEGTIPPEHINRFVNTYHKVKAVPQPDYSRIKDAAELHISSDGKMAVLLSEQNRMLAENNDLQRATIKALKGREVNVSLDKNGFAASYLEVVEQIKRDKRI